jgi:hypothetical protein
MKNEDFEKQWQDAFQDKQRQPPPSVWEQIEARLDQKEDKKPVVILPLWNRLGWVAAATVATILGAGIWAWRGQAVPSAAETVVATNTPDKSPKVARQQNQVKTPLSDATPTPSKIATNTEKSPNATNTKTEKSPNAASTKTEFYANNRAPIFAKKSKQNSRNLNNETTKIFEKTLRLASKNEPFNSESEPYLDQNQQPTLNQNSQLALNQNHELTVAPLAVGMLLPKGYKNLLGATPRQPWVNVDALQQTKKTPTTPRKTYWAALNLAPTNFNAALNVPSAVYASSGANFASNSDLAGNNQNQAALSIAVQSQVGVQLSKRWSLETGLGYLRGNSVYNSSLIVDSQQNPISNSLETAVIQSPNSSNWQGALDAQKIGPQSPQGSISSLTFSTLQATKNQYNYVQLPIQAGFAVLPAAKKLSLWALGGVVNNFLLQNNYENGQRNTVSFGTGQGPFRTFSMATTTGLRLQYRLAHRWNATLTGNYQHSLSNNTHVDAAFSARPWWWSVGWGVRYGL